MKEERAVMETKEKFELKKRIGLWSGVAITVSAMIGSGIFVSPTGVLRSVHGSVGVSLIIWVVCGLTTMSSCLCYCELGTSLKASGEDFLNFKLVYGPALTFVYVWGCLMVRPGSAATYQVFASYLISPIYSNCNPPTSIVKIVAVMLLFGLHYINYVSVKLSVKFEVIFTAAKVVALFLISVVGIVNLASGNPVGINNFANAFDSKHLSQLQVTDISQAVYQGIFAYGGFNALTSVAEEMKDVSKNLHRAAILAFSSVMGIYLLVNVGYFSVLTPKEMIESTAVAELFGERALGVMSWVIPLSVCISTIGHLNGVVLLRARKIFVASRSNLGPRIFGMIHIKYYTPASAIVIVCIVTSVFIAIGDFDSLIDAFSFFQWTCQGLSAVSLLLLRKKFPNLPRPYKAPIFCPIFSAVVSAYFIVTPFIQNPNPIYFFTIAFYFAAAISYYLFIVRGFRIPGTEKLYMFVQKLMQIAETDWNNYADIHNETNELHSN